MATFSELVRGFRCNVRDGIPTVLAYDGKTIKLNCSSNINGYVGLTTRKGQYEVCDMTGQACKWCSCYDDRLNPSCKHNLVKPII